MKYTIILLIVLLNSCKTEPKKEVIAANGADASVYTMWSDYTGAYPEFKNDEQPESDSFHTNKEDADRLAQLILNGKKKAGSSLYSVYEKYQIDLPKIGRKQIVTNFEGEAVAIIEVTSVDILPFNQISEAYAAMDMGTNNGPLEKWKKAHWTFFSSFLKESGEEPTETMLIVCEQFKIIWPERK
ncbi:MAG: ASCH domain-containing protein [Maribacter sp.]